MFPLQLLFALTTDSLTIDLASWVPRRMAEHRVPGAAVTVVTPNGPAWTWTYGVENVLTRRPVGPKTRWPLGTGVDGPGAAPLGAGLAASHARLTALLPPGLIILGVFAAVAWVLLIPVSASVRKRWRFGRWHEVLAVVLAAPFAWLYLRRLGGPVLATYFTVMALSCSLLPLLAAALTWPRSRIAATVLLPAAALLAWSARNLVVPMPAAFSGRGAIDLVALGDLSTRALAGDSAAIAGLGLQWEGDRRVARQNGRGSAAIIVIIPERRIGVVAVANAGGSEDLLREVTEAVLR